MFLSPPFLVVCTTKIFCACSSPCQHNHTNALFRTHPVAHIRPRRHGVPGGGPPKITKICYAFFYPGLDDLLAEGSHPRGLALTLTVTLRGLAVTLTVTQRGLTITAVTIRGLAVTLTVIIRGLAVTLTVTIRGLAVTLTVTTRGLTVTD